MAGIYDYGTWYAAFVVTGHEDAVKARMEEHLDQRKDVEATIFIPKRLVRERREGKQHEVLRVMFPGYVLIGTEQIQLFADMVTGVQGVFRFLRDVDVGGSFQQIHLDEIARLVYLTDEDGVIGESEVTLNENDRIVVLSGPLKGNEGWITKFDRRKGRVCVEFMFDGAKHKIWLAVRLVDGAAGARDGSFKNGVNFMRRIDMYYLFKDGSSELSFSLEGEFVQVSYFSIFDSSTHETSSFQASFDQAQFREQLDSLATKGRFVLSNSLGDSMELSGPPQRSFLSLSSKAPGQSFSISGISYDLSQFVNWANNIK